MSDAMEAARLAILAAGPITDGREREWNLKVAQLSMQIAAMLRTPSADNADLATTPIVVARKVLEADVYRAEYVSHEDDVNRKTGVKSHRMLVRLKPEHGKPKYLDQDGCEYIRTEPSWTPAGFVMQRLIRSLAPSTPCLIYKCVEGFVKDDGDETEDRKSRVLAHLEVIGKPRNPPAEPRPAPQQAERARAGGEAGGAARPPTSAPPAASQATGVVVERFEKLNPKQRIAFGRYCSGRQIPNFMEPDPEHIDAVLVVLGKIERGEPLA